jgi:hypothetical protein
VTGRRGRRRRKLLDDLKERSGYSHLKEKALDRTMWRAGFGRGFGPVVRQTTKHEKIVNELMYTITIVNCTRTDFICIQSGATFNSTYGIPTTGVFLIYTTTHCSLLRLIVRSGLNVSTFATRRLHACHHTRAPSGERWNCGQEMPGKFCLNADFHVTFRDLLHAVKLRHGTDGFTSPPKEGVLRILSP